MNLGNKKSIRGILTMVLIVSVGLHLVGLFVFGVVRIAQEALREEQTFEAPPLVAAPEEIPPPPSIEQRTQQSAPPRPNPITVEAPQDIELPALGIDVNVDSVSAYGRGSGGFGGGGGVQQIREMSLDLEFFGASTTGSNLVFIVDCTHSGTNVFRETREELLKSVEQMRGTDAQFAVIYFGGSVAGHVVPRGKNGMDVDPTEVDYWFPKGVREREWIEPGSEQAASVLAELKAVDPRSPQSRVTFAKDLDQDGAFFVLGT